VKSPILGVVVALWALVTIGCGGGSSAVSGPPGINVIVTSPTGAAALDSDKTLPIKVQVTNDSGNAGVTWTLTPAQDGGSLSQPTATSVTYVPPAGVTSPLNVSITATSVTDNTRSASIPIAVYPQLAVFTNSSDLATAFVNTNYNCFQLAGSVGQNGTLSQYPCQVYVAPAIGVTKGQLNFGPPTGLGPYTWSITSGQLPDGLSLSPTTVPYSSGIVGLPTTSEIYPFELTVADSLGDTAKVSLTINVAPKQLKAVTPTLVSTVDKLPYTPVPLVVSGGVPPYTWSLVPGSFLPPGMSLAPNGVISGTPTDGRNYPFAVRVQDSQSPVPAEAILPSPAGGNTLNLASYSGGESTQPCQNPTNGFRPGTPYAFLFAGFAGSGPMTLSGSFTSDQNRNLTGVEDILSNPTAQPLPANSTFIFDSFSRGCLTLGSSFLAQPTGFIPNDNHFGAGRIIGFDSTEGAPAGTGQFRFQDSTAFSGFPADGQYAFRLSGWDVDGGHFAMAGVLAAAGGQFNLVSADVNDAGALLGNQTGDATFSSVDPSTGRGTASIAVGQYVLDLVFYVVDADHFIFNSQNPASANKPLVTGEATATASSFSESSLVNSHIFRLGGIASSSADLAVGVLHFENAPALSGLSMASSGSSPSTTSLSGQFTVDASTGRLKFSGTAIPAVGYVVSSPNSDGITAYLVGTGTSAASGVMEFQTASYPPGFQFGPLSGTYEFGTDEMLDPAAPVYLGSALSLSPNGGISTDTYFDTYTPQGLIPLRGFSAFLYTWSPDGSGTFGANTYMVSYQQIAGAVTYSKFYYIDISSFDGHPSIMVGKLPR